MSTIITAPGLPNIISFVNVPPLAPAPNQAPTDLAFPAVLSVPANLTGTKIRISANGFVLIPSGNIGSGIVGVSITDTLLTKPPVQGASARFKIDGRQTVPFGLEAYVWLDSSTGRIRDINTSSPGSRPQFTGPLPRGGSFFGTEGIPSFSDSAGKGPIFDTAGPYRTGTQATFDFTIPTPLQVLAEVWNNGEQGLNLPSLAFQLTNFQLEY